MRLSEPTIRANVDALLDHLEDAGLRRVYRIAPGVEHAAAGLSQRIDALGVRGKGRRVIVEALIRDPEGLRLYGVLFGIVSMFGPGWTLMEETPA